VELEAVTMASRKALFAWTILLSVVLTLLGGSSMHSQENQPSPMVIFSVNVEVVNIFVTVREIINVNKASSLDAALGAVISRLRIRYSLSYYPTSASEGGAYHSITVRLTDRYGKAGSDYFMHAKRGYYATAASSASAAE
jgi:hypothetical protein